MLHIIDKTIQLTRGDSAMIQVSIANDANGAEYELDPNDILRMTVKSNVRNTDYVFQKELSGSTSFHIVPEDTRDAQFGKYVYDVELTTVDGEVYTIIEPSVFEITKEVTF